MAGPGFNAADGYFVSISVEFLSSFKVCGLFANHDSVHASTHTQHGDKWEDDHAKDRILIEKWRHCCNTLLNTSTSAQEKTHMLNQLHVDIPLFLSHFLEHLQGEEDHLNPIGKRYIPLELQKQLARKAFEITSAEHWEVILPYLINNLPRTGQRVRLLKTLCWSMPERAQQLGAIMYRGCDSVKWELISFEIPEIIPRGVSNWRRYY